MARDKQLIEKRNKKIIERYKDLYDNKRMRHDDVLEKLHEEFFITVESIRRIIYPAKKRNIEVV